MSTRGCSVEGCPAPEHARGYCRRHYGRLWRGKPISGPVSKNEPPANLSIESLRRQLEDARRNHELVVGVAGKVRWARIIRELEEGLRRSQNLDKLEVERRKVFAAATAG